MNGNLIDDAINARAWNGAFIALICGNFSAFTTPGPVPPRLIPGTYTLREDVPAGFRRTAAEPAGIVVDYGIGDRAFAGNDFGNQRVTDLVVEKDAEKAVTIAGESLEWTLKVTSHGVFDTPDVVVDDELPAGVESVVALGPACTLAGRHIHCALGTIAPGAQRILRFRTKRRPDCRRRRERRPARSPART